MTRTKIERIRGELLGQYGDIALVRIFDRNTGVLLREVTLASAPIGNTADMKEIRKIIREGKPRTFSA